MVPWYGGTVWWYGGVLAGLLCPWWLQHLRLSGDTAAFRAWQALRRAVDCVVARDGVDGLDRAKGRLKHSMKTISGKVNPIFNVFLLVAVMTRLRTGDVEQAVGKLMSIIAVPGFMPEETGDDVMYLVNRCKGQLVEVLTIGLEKLKQWAAVYAEVCRTTSLLAKCEADTRSAKRATEQAEERERLAQSQAAEAKANLATFCFV